MNKALNITTLLTLIAFTFCNGFAFAQQKYTLKGKVVNENAVPVEFIHVSLLKSDTILVEGTATDSLGLFSFMIAEGNYTLLIEQFGTEFQKKEIQLDHDLNLGEIQIDENVLLEEVTIIARKKLIERKADRLVFNVENATATIGGDALDALKITPRVKVQNDQITMVGKTGMSLMIDDKIVQLHGDDLINYLKTIKADDIRSVEVITNPPAKYNAEGNSGIINIKTKKMTTDAWNGSLRATYKQATHTTGSSSASFNLKKNKLELSTSFSHLQGSIAPVESSTINYPDVTWQEVNNRKDFSNVTSANIGLDYQFTNKITTGIIYKHVNSMPVIHDNNTSYISGIGGSTIDSLFTTNGKNEKNRISNQFNYHLVYKIDSVGKKLSLDYDFFDYINDASRSFTTNKIIASQKTPSLAAINKGEQDVSNSAISIDMEHPIKWVTLNYGGKLSFITTKNDFKHYKIVNDDVELDIGQSNVFKYKENIQSLYFSAHKQISEKWEAKIGFRMENTQTEGISPILDQTNKTNYTQFFPTAYLMHNINPDNSVSLNYGRRIQRPSYNFLNPFKLVISPYMYSEGNPFLQPSFTNNLELGYNHKDNFITYIYYTHIDGGFGQVTFLDSNTNIQRIITRNYLINNIIGFNQTVLINPLPWLSASIFADVYYSSSSSKLPETLQSLSGWNGEFTINSDVSLNKARTAFMNFNFLYVTDGVIGIDENTDFNQLDISFKMLLFDKKLTTSLHVNDVFSSNRPVYTTYTNSIKNSFRNYYDNRYVRLSLVYNFGNTFKKETLKEKNSEEYNRVR